MPGDRVRDPATFEIKKVDYAGLVYLRSGKKVWYRIYLFTCAVYRAVHLDVDNSLLIVDFLNTLRRFVTMRGRPRVIYSDNGTTFCGAENLFSQLD